MLQKYGIFRLVDGLASRAGAKHKIFVQLVFWDEMRQIDFLFATGF